MSSTVLLALQSLLGALQVVNAGLATVTQNKMVALIASAVIMGLSMFVQNVGNKTVPPPPPQGK